MKSLALALAHRLVPMSFPACVLASGVLGCGRHATAADCQLIVDKSVELQLKEMSETDAAAIAEHESHIRSELEDQIQSCQARRVTDKTMACVKAATSGPELDKCLR